MWNPDYASVMQEKGLNTSESLSKLSDSEQVPEIGSYCLVITNKKITAVKLDGEYDYDETIKKLREFIMKGRSLSESSVNIRRMELYEKLIAPVEKYIPSGTKDIVIVPDGNLSSLPFEILGDDKGKDFGEKYNLSFSPSVSVSMLKQKNQKTETRFLGFGNPVYNIDGASKNRGLNDLPDVEPAAGKLYANAGEYYAERKFKWANLPGTGMELNTLKDNVFTESSSQIIESMESTEKHLKRLSKEGKLSEYTNLHFACHGYFNETDSNLSSIVLSEVSGSITDSEEDGYLTLPEIATLNISCDFLNLSACQTGLSHQKRGDGMSGLTRSCIVAGADEVGATLWEVSDEATCQFMVSMYSKVKKGMTYKEAYRKTKSEFRKCDYSEPVFWAAFVIWE